MTSSQLAEWEAYNVLDPIGEERADFRTSYLAWTITNLMIQAHSTKNAKLAKFEDFLFNWDGEQKVEKKQSVEEMKTILMNLARTQNRQQERIEGKRVREKLKK